MRCARLFGLGRHHPNIVAKRARDFLCDRKARCVDAIIIGDKNAHLGSAAFSSPNMGEEKRDKPVPARDAGRDRT